MNELTEILECAEAFRKYLQENAGSCSLSKGMCAEGAEVIGRLIEELTESI